MDKRLVRNILETMKRFRYRLLLACVLLLVSNGLLILNPLIFREALLVLTSQAPMSSAWLGAYSHSIYAWALLLFSIALVSSCLKYAMRLIFLAISRQVELEMRDKLFERIQSQSKAFFDRHGIGDLLSRLTNDITAYRDMLGPGMMFPALFISLVIPALIVLFFLSPLLAAISFIPIIGMFVLNGLVQRPMVNIAQQVQQSLADMSLVTHEHYSGIKLIKSYGIEHAASLIFKSCCHLFSRLNMRFASFESLIYPALVLVTKLVTLVLAIVASGIILLGWSSMTLADFLSFMWIQSYLFGPLLMLAWIIPMYQRGRAAYYRLVEIYQEPIETYTFSNPLAHIPPKADIEFRGLSFAYPNQDSHALKDIHLHIKTGSLIGITGPVGAGKTTIFRLLNREYEVPEEQIFIDGKDIHSYSLSAFHQEIVTVEQLPFLFSKTIKDNVRFGKSEASEEELEWVAKQADLHETVLEFPSRYETLVGERGVSLSGGQKQRVAIARAFLVDRSILLLDDIFSALDAATEKRIFDALKANYQGKTIILITHRVSILEQLDRVIYMKEGRIVEEGPPQELIQRQGPYQALADLQKLSV